MSRRSCLRWAAAILATPLAARAGCPCDDDDVAQDQSPAAPKTPAKTLRICADPANLPYSNRSHEGFEDKIAELIARDLDLTLEYQWLPQRLGFYRQALKASDAALVMAAPAGFDKALVSRPYYRSSYVFVHRAGTPVQSLDDPVLRTLRIGVQLTGGANTPPTHALARRQLIENVRGYPVFDEREGRPGARIVEAVSCGEIDVALAWGPQAGYFAHQQSPPLQVTPVSPSSERIGNASLAFTFAICVALRRANKELRDSINGVIARRQPEIDRILDDYHVPRLPRVEAGAGTDFGTSNGRRG